MTQEYKLLWTTDIHLNFVHEKRIEAFCNRILRQEPDGVVITGDISEAPFLFDHLSILDMKLKHIPIFFVCGNHDYYHGSIATLRERLAEFFSYNEGQKLAGDPKLAWLGSSGVVPLSERTALIGADGWYDGIYANWLNSRVELNDYLLISEFVFHYHDRQTLLDTLRDVSKKSADYVEKNLKEALENGYEEVVVATHVPPWRENATYNGKISDDQFMPHFSSAYMGDAITKVASQYPNQSVTVLCGHSHGKAHHKPLENVNAYTGEARYKHPSIAGVFNL